MGSFKTRERKPGSPIKDRGAKGRISTAHHPIVSLSLIIFSLLVAHSLTPVLCNEEKKILTIPALGRPAHLGYLYESLSDSFRPVSVFKEAVPETFVTTTETPNTDVTKNIIKTFSDKLRLLNVDPNSGASVLLGIVRAKGSSRFLITEEIGKPNEVHGALIYTTETLAQDLQIYAEGLKSLYTKELVQQHRTASHVLTGIVWGARVSISFKCTARDVNSSKQEMEKALMSTMEKITQATENMENDLNLDNDPDNICNISMVAAADVSLLIQKLTPRTLKQAQELLQSQLPPLIQTTNGGKGVPLYYTLTPLSTFQKYFSLPPRTTVSFPDLSTENSLQELLEIFDEISDTRQKIKTLHSTLESHPSCVHSDTLKNATDLQNNFSNHASNFKSVFVATLSAVRAGRSSTTSLSDLAQDYRSNDVAVENILQNLSQFSNALQKIRFYTHLKNFYNDIEYCGKVKDEQKQQQENGLLSRIFENRANSVYMFFTKTEFKQKDPAAYEDQLSTFYKILYKPHNKLFFVDCDFEFLQCTEINRTVIQKFKNGQVTIHDVDREIKRPKDSVSLEVKAMGRCAKIGDLYDARTDSFIGQSILSPAQEPALSLSVTPASRINLNDISSETYEGKFNGLNVDPETQFSILGGLIKLAHSGLYLDQAKAENAHVRSFAFVKQIAVGTIDLSHPQFTESLATQVINVTTATHFVSRIDHGFNSIFSIESHRPSGTTSGYDTPYKADLKLEKFVQNLKTCLTRSNPGNNSRTALLQEWTENFKIKLFSDLQNTNPTTFMRENVDDLFEYLNIINYSNFPRNYSQQNQQPIVYVLMPIESILGQEGIVQRAPLYSTVSSTGEDPLKFAKILDTVNTAREQIEDLSVKLKQNPECTTDADLQTMKKIEGDFDITLGAMKPQLGKIISKIKSGVNFEPSGAEELQRMRTEFETNNYFGDDLMYKELSQMSLFQEKLQLYRQTQGQSSAIQYLGRPNDDKISFSQIFTQSVSGSEDEIIKVYLLFYKPSWTREEGTAWQRSSQLFFGTLSSRSNKNFNSSDSSRAFYLVDCDFHQLQCANILQPVIYEFTNGRLTSSNVTETMEKIETSWERKHQDLADEIVTLQDGITYLNNVTSSNSGNIDTVVSGMKSLQQTVTTNQQLIDLLRSEVQTGNFSISEQWESIKTIRQNVSSNQHDIRVLTSRVLLSTTTTTTPTTTTPRPTTTRTTASTTPTTTTTTTTTPRPTTTRTTATTTTTPTTTTQRPLFSRARDLTLSCGGSIPMYEPGQVKLIGYKVNEMYSNNERCLWPLLTETNNIFHFFSNNIRKKQTLQITLISHGFAESVDWIYAVKFNRETGLVSQKIEQPHVQYTFSEEQLYLSFTSDHSVIGTGFVIQLSVSESVEIGRGWTTYRPSSPGDVAGGAYANNDLINIVVNPKTGITFEVNYVRTEDHSSCDYDRLMVWEIGHGGNVAEKARLCGNISGTSSRFTTTNPVVASLTTDGSNTGPSNAGFQVSWR